MANTPTIPSPDNTPDGLYQSVVALKQSVDIVHGNFVPGPAPKTVVAIKVGAAISAVIRLNP